MMVCTTNGTNAAQAYSREMINGETFVQTVRGLVEVNSTETDRERKFTKRAPRESLDCHFTAQKDAVPLMEDLVVTSCRAAEACDGIVQIQISQ